MRTLLRSFFVAIPAFMLAPQASAKDGCDLELNKDAKKVLEQAQSLSHEANGYYCGNWERGAPSYIIAAVDGDNVHYAYRVQIDRRNYDYDGSAELKQSDEGHPQFKFRPGTRSQLTATIVGNELHGIYFGSRGRSSIVMKRQGDQASLDAE